MNTAVSTEVNQVAAFSRFLDKFKPQMALALPKHLTADRMTRLALTAFSSTPALQECTPQSIASSIMMASTLGLEPGVNGQGYLIPYKGRCTFVPGWKGLVDIANRSGRCTVWTGAVFEGDDFEYALGDRPFVQHRPGDEDDPSKLVFVYAVGRVKGSDWPVIEVWRTSKVLKHRDHYNKVGAKHYSFRDWEMYARKVPLLQVLKYMPASIELSNALAVSNAAEEGRSATFDGNFVTVDPAEDDYRGDQGNSQPMGGQQAERQQQQVVHWTADAFKAAEPTWRKALEKKGVEGIIAMAETKAPLSDDQKKVIRSWAPPASESAATQASGAVHRAGQEGPTFTESEIAAKLDAATDMEQLAQAGSLISSIADAKARNRLSVKYDERGEFLSTQE